MNSGANVSAEGATRSGGGKGRKSDLEFEDLVAEEEDKNWKGICIAILVITSIISCIAVAIVILTPADGGPRVKNERISLEDIISGQFQPEPFEGSWISDSEVVLKNTEGSLVIFDALINSSYVIVPNTTLRQFNVQRFSVSSDKKFALLVHDIRKVYERSFVAKYKLVNISNEHVISLEVGGVSGQDIQFASFGPKGNQLVAVHRNNIYYVNSVADWVNNNVRKLTHNGQEGIIFNGIPDWLYSDKIFGQSEQNVRQASAIWFSSEGNKLSYVTFDDSKVSPMSYPKYGSYDDPSNVYPSLVTLRYPLAGRDNPIVSVFVVDLSSSGLDSKKVVPPSDVGRDHYFTAFSWIDEDKAAVIWMRREQNFSLVSLCSPDDKTWNCEKHLQERVDSESPGWVEMFDAPLITTDKRYYLLRLPRNDADSGSFRQIAMITINGRVKNFLTQGQHDVTRILGHRTDLRTAFYIGTLEDKPADRHIFSIPDIHSASARIPSCLTCNQTDRNCSFHDASFSHKSSYYILRCLGSGAPWTEIRSVEDNQIIMTSELDRNVLSLMNERSFPQFRSLQIPLKGSKEVAEVSLILPPSLREYEFMRFPLVVQIMSDPGSQSVSSKLVVDWGLYLASKRDFIYARIDVRGSRYSGDRNLHEPWHRLGVVEVEDYLHVIDVLKADLHYVDPKRTAVWGWSYGAFVAASLISNERSNLNCAIAVAPITNWLFADSFTAERYFGHPWSSGNYIRYEKSDLIHKAINFRDRNLFIIHGTADDTVHLQNSFAFMKSLNDAGVIYKSQLYPDSNHNLDDVKYHFYKSMESYLLDSFKLSEDEDLVELQASLKSAPLK